MEQRTIKEKHMDKDEQCEERIGKGGALTFLAAVAATRKASGITMTTQTQTSGSAMCVCLCRIR